MFPAQGEVTAIIGGTGRGKSSILKLIPRLYDPMFGEVLIDGVNAKEYRTQDSAGPDRLCAPEKLFVLR